MKTPKKDKVKAYIQAKKYAENLPPSDLPFGILISDFISFDYYDLEKNGEPVVFSLEELPQKVELFAYLAGYKDIVFEAVSPVDIEAAEHMGELYDALKENGYTGHELEMYLVRLLFCLFADDTGIFDEKKAFYKYILDRTNVDGSDLAMHLGLIFDTLNKPKEKRQKNIDEIVNKFPYIDGSLFEKHLETAAFNSNMRKTLLKCCTLDWSKIKPEIFGAMFQSVNDKEKRRALGEHYTSEANILKIIKPLFLDELWYEFKKIKKLSTALRQQRLLEFHTKLQNLKFLDPACGCGNFLVVTYRELRLLEIEVLSEYLHHQKVIDIELYVRVNVDQFYGIEILEFPARIAQTALWLMDHLMNTEASKRFGKYITRIPLTASPSIMIADALPLDWESLIPKSELSYIMGNPPFVGIRHSKEYHRDNLKSVTSIIKNAGQLDYVTAWYIKAAQYIKNTKIKTAFVSTNSIIQGEQATTLWKYILEKNQMYINFAYQSFIWTNEAKGKAAVHCVIIGFWQEENKNKSIFSYNEKNNNWNEQTVKIINQYLLPSEIIWIYKSSKPLENVQEMQKGCYPTDDGNYVYTKKEMEEFIKLEPLSKKYFRRWIGSEDLLQNYERYILFLKDVSPADLNSMPHVKKRIENVREFRLCSTKAATREKANTPILLDEERIPLSSFLVIPVVSSENRHYIPIAYKSPPDICYASAFFIDNANLYTFGIITSIMHMAWMRVVCGRLKSDYRYSNTLVDNNFPWPKPTDTQKNKIEKYAQEILDIRKNYPESSLADMYNPLTMPSYLIKAHQKLDKAVDAAYGKTFENESERVAHLFYLYQIMTEGLLVDKPKRKKK
jgi:hypothetical protein